MHVKKIANSYHGSLKIYSLKTGGKYAVVTWNNLGNGKAMETLRNACLSEMQKAGFKFEIGYHNNQISALI
jgi:hypothetical protein